MKKPNLILAGSIIVIILLVGAVASYLLLSGRSLSSLPRMGERKVSDIKLNQDLLYVAQPITGVDGKLTSIKDGVITVTHHYLLSNTVSGVSQDQKTKDVSFQFSITPKTKIFRPPTWVPYLFKQNVPNADETLKPGDLKNGQFVAVTSNGDLKIAQSDPYQATSIQVTRIANNIQGSISQITGNSFTMTAPLPPLPASLPPQTSEAQQTYTVHITPDTEISQLTADQLTKGTVVMVYAFQDVGVETQLTALRIEPVDTRSATITIMPKTKL